MENNHEVIFYDRKPRLTVEHVNVGDYLMFVDEHSDHTLVRVVVAPDSLYTLLNVKEGQCSNLAFHTIEELLNEVRSRNFKKVEIIKDSTLEVRIR